MNWDCSKKFTDEDDDERQTKSDGTFGPGELKIKKKKKKGVDKWCVHVSSTSKNWTKITFNQILGLWGQQKGWVLKSDLYLNYLFQ